jgi:hypothetical protein
MTLQVDQDGAVALPLALGPIINAEDPNRFLDWEGLAAQETKEMSRTGFHTKRSRQPAAAFPTQRKADRTQGVRQLSSTTTTSLDERRHALAEDAARTGTITTEEAARVETQDHPGAATGKIVHNAHVLTVDVAGPPRGQRPVRHFGAMSRSSARSVPTQEMIRRAERWGRRWEAYTAKLHE